MWTCPECGRQMQGYGIASHRDRHARNKFKEWLRVNPVQEGDVLLSPRRSGEQRLVVTGIREFGVEARPEQEQPGHITRYLFRLGSDLNPLERVSVERQAAV